MTMIIDDRIIIIYFELKTCLEEASKFVADIPGRTITEGGWSHIHKAIEEIIEITEDVEYEKFYFNVETPNIKPHVNVYEFMLKLSALVGRLKGRLEAALVGRLEVAE